MRDATGARGGNTGGRSPPGLACGLLGTHCVVIRFLAAPPERWGIRACIGVVVGIVLSGPLAVLWVESSHPQPPWQSAQVWVDHYHPGQLLPYAGGFVLVASSIAWIASVHAGAARNRRGLSAAALVFTGAFAALIFLNYLFQAVVLPSLVSDYDPNDATLVAALSMANPRSLAWQVEMWGWGAFGVATWLVAPTFGGSRLERATGIAFTANGVLSVVGAVLTVVLPGWVLSSGGLVAFATWNGLLLVMALLCLRVFRARLASPLPRALPTWE